jgi:hypothetical protein
LLLISINRYSLEFKFNTTTHENTPNPSDAAFVSPSAGSCRIGQPLARHSRALVVEAATEGREATTSGEGKITASLPIAIGAPGDTLRMSGGVGDIQENLFLAPVLGLMGKTPEDLFPANRITVKCSKCHNFIPRGEGYKHSNLGEHKTYCFNCQKSMGLPTREGAAERSEALGASLSIINKV